MARFNNILVATDFSVGSAHACDIARSLAELSGAKLVLFHAITQLVDPQSRQLPSSVLETLITEVERHAVEDMHRFRDKHFSGCDVTTEITIGKADEALLEHAARIDADLIVLGTRGRDDIGHMILGSTAEKVVRRSRIPVLTVRG